jgi:DNA repair exonuclease SbcCD ATPase subunit
MVRDQGQAWISKIKNLENALRIVYKQREDLKEKLRASEEKLSASEEQTQKLQRALDKRKNLKYMQCRICDRTKENWRILGCGHVYCTICISEMNMVEPLFNSNCPECREPIESCTRFYPNLVEDDN